MRNLKLYFCLLSLIFLTVHNQGLAFGFQQEQSLFNYETDELSAQQSDEPAAPRQKRKIKINKLALESKTGSDFSLPLPDGKSYRARPMKIEKRAAKDLSWFGKLSGVTEGLNDVILSQKGGILSGLIYTPEALYQISSEDGVTHTISEVDPSEAPTCKNAVLPAAATDGATTEQNTSITTQATTSAVPVDILVVYTAAARTAAGGAAAMASQIQLAVDAANQAFTNSNVNVQLRLVHAAEVAYTETGSAFPDLQWVQQSAEVAQLRNTYKADLVSFFVEQMNDAAGLGYVMAQGNDQPYFEAYAFTVVKRQFASSHLVLAHEIGHNFGCNHDIENVPQDQISMQLYPYAFGYKVSGSFATVMAYANNCNNCRTVPYFSNANVLINNVAAGIPDQKENYRVINSTAALVSSFRAGTSTPTTSCSVQANATVPASAVKGSSVSFAGSATASNCSGSNLYDWDFGDGTAHSNQQNPTHVYQTAGTFTWKVTISNGSTSGSRTGTITISAPAVAPASAITVTTPNGGDNWTIGTTRTIRWNYSGNVGTSVKIELFKAGAFNRTITTAAAIGANGSGSFNWYVPAQQVTGSDFTIKVTSIANTAVADSSNANFTISPYPLASGLIANGGFETSASPWVLAASAFYTNTGAYPHSGNGYIYLGNAVSTTGTAYQQFTIPSTATTANLSFWLNVNSSDTATTAVDTLAVEVRDTAGNLLGTLATYSNLNKAAGSIYYQRGYFNLLAYRGRTIRLQFRATNNATGATVFRIDDVAVQ